MEKQKEVKKTSSFRYLERLGLLVIFLVALVTAYYYVTARLVQKDNESIHAQSSVEIQESENGIKSDQ